MRAKERPSTLLQVPCVCAVMQLCCPPRGGWTSLCPTGRARALHMLGGLRAAGGQERYRAAGEQRAAAHSLFVVPRQASPIRAVLQCLPQAGRVVHVQQQTCRQPRHSKDKKLYTAFGQKGWTVLLEHGAACKHCLTLLLQQGTPTPVHSTDLSSTHLSHPLLSYHC